MKASEWLTTMRQVSVAAGQVWWLYGPPSAGKSATAWALFTQVSRTGFSGGSVVTRRR